MKRSEGKENSSEVKRSRSKVEADVEKKRRKQKRRQAKSAVEATEKED